MDNFVISLSEAEDSKLVGGKAAALGVLIRAGFNVPDGFVVTTNSDMKMTSNLESQILDKYNELGSKLVAVRSSAVSEDSKDAAWAGQFDTFLNVERDNLIKNVKKCWASSSSERAQAYGKEKNLESGKVSVVVQAMVPAQTAGVAFSSHPVTSDRNQIVIEAVEGLGEKLVSGSATPDTYVVDKESGKLSESSLSGKEAILNGNQIEKIADQVKDIEILFGFPIDVEWASASGQLYILQSRPITTLN